MRRNYAREARERGVEPPGFGTSPGCLAWYAYRVLDRRQKRNFCRRAGLAPVDREGDILSLWRDLSDRQRYEFLVAIGVWQDCANDPEPEGLDEYPRYSPEEFERISTEFHRQLREEYPDDA